MASPAVDATGSGHLIIRSTEGLKLIGIGREMLSKRSYVSVCHYDNIIAGAELMPIRKKGGGRSNAIPPFKI